MSANKEEQVKATPLIEEQVLAQETVINGNQDTARQQDETPAEVHDVSANKEV